MKQDDVSILVIGGGQAGLACGYYLQRSGQRPGRDFLILDAEQHPGGAWQHAWSSLTLFSPSGYSSLPGAMMPPWTDGFPPASHVRSYLERYESRYDLGVVRPVRVVGVRRSHGKRRRYAVHTTAGIVHADVVVSATGTWNRPFWPTYPGQREFGGTQIHTADYRSPDRFAGQRVIVVGGGNSAAQLLAEISTVAETTWVTPRPPRFLPDDVDGRVLFAVASDRSAALARGERDDGGVASLGDIVMVPSVLQARARGVLHAVPPFERLTTGGVVWCDGTTARADAIVWCTGFRPELTHLAPLGLTRRDGHPVVRGTESVDAPGVYLVGYGDWTGDASATLIGAGRSARTLVRPEPHGP
ncbi:ArsO family NAD(P)H-dependent flavin-containing monooxygenase [Aeromicrobium sp. CF3.5]|uniref:ArsO family NAD(P)H-dependent flavin-containing monooxygenase n=1 Tax=Aeromicrobium sp. CF3.5 TaxID=3373078 RepID=UPI003EE46530